MENINNTKYQNNIKDEIHRPSTASSIITGSKSNLHTILLYISLNIIDIFFKGISNKTVQLPLKHITKLENINRPKTSLNQSYNRYNQIIKLYLRYFYYS